MNTENLKPFTAANAKENGAKGGRASGESKRKRKQIRECLAELLEKKSAGSDDCNAMLVSAQVVNQAIKGNLRATRLLLQVTGELDRNKTIVNDAERQTAYEKGYKDGMGAVMDELPKETLLKLADLTEK